MDRGAIGRRAEKIVADWLRAHGIEVLDTNVRAGRLEVDVLAREGAVVAVVEVRTRGGGAWQKPFDSIDRKKRDRLRRAGERIWRDRFAHVPDVERMRFDCASVTFTPDGEAVVEYVKAVF